MPGIRPSQPMKLSERINSKFFAPTKLNYPKPQKNSLTNLSPETRIVDPFPRGGDGQVTTSRTSINKFF